MSSTSASRAKILRCSLPLQSTPFFTNASTKPTNFSTISRRISRWRHLFNEDIISMPDKWEYPWYAAWDLAFHAVAIAPADPDFAKAQLSLFLREWYMHPNGQIPAYEWAFGDVNPPVHAW